MICPHCKKETEEKIIKIKELNLEVTKPTEWTKPYSEIKVPEGFRMMSVIEFFQIVETEYFEKIFTEKGVYIYLKQIKIDKKNNLSRWVFLYGDDDLDSRSGNFDCSDDVGRVVFVRDLI